ncbi:hypothetical protein FOA43_002629 [Brettanomyces nanus]|uniref:Cysteine protease RIM13 n=1 Tax=Eeniella nana TaxID=13502 RepID=A0A875S2U7_EENNA|nr:uncharacterized protein FOA43_002629 [Brettanomyces nanus]QPG75278.1 hypothetical protein FOA43_002629 [Brettanomyces nanus]
MAKSPSSYHIDLKESNGLTDIFQGDIDNCSFVSAFQAIVLYDLGTSLRGLIKETCQGTYTILFNVNGCQRDCPVSSELSEKRIHSSTNPGLLWPAIIEKAYLELYQYSSGQFQGSNFGNDCYLLTGFIPEYVAVEDIDMAFMANLNHYFHDKQAILGLAVDNLTDDEISVFRLVPNHDYSITEITENDGKFLITVKDPSVAENSLRVFLLDEIYGRFKTLYINWNSTRFTYRESKSFVMMQSKRFNNDSFIDDYQFRVSFTNETWVLLERHERREVTDQQLPGGISSIQWYEGEGKLWKSSDGKYISSVPVSNSRFTLCKLDLKGIRKAVGVFRLPNEADEHVFYTLMAYSTSPVTIERPRNRLKYTEEVIGNWSTWESGGNWSESTWYDNPQYEIIADGGTTDTVACAIGIFSDCSLHIALHVFDHEFGQFNRVFYFSRKELVTDIKRYNEGFNTCLVRLQAHRKYVLVCSTYNTAQLGEFKLMVNSDALVRISKIPHELGLFTKRIDTEIMANGEDWTLVTSFKLKRASRVNIKAICSNLDISQLRLLNAHTVKDISSMDVHGSVSFLGSQKTKLQEGRYEIQVKITTRQKVKVDLEIGTDYKI